jgi:hypothetical protein
MLLAGIWDQLELLLQVDKSTIRCKIDTFGTTTTALIDHFTKEPIVRLGLMQQIHGDNARLMGITKFG